MVTIPIFDPPGFPTGNLATQDIYSISRFLNDETTVLRALRLIADQIFIGNKILTGQFYTENGSIIYEQIESIFAANTPQPVNPGGEYPETPVPTGPAQLANILKWGLDTPITDESINRQNFDVVARAFIKIVNSLVAQIDSLIMSAFTAAITETVNAGSLTVTGASLDAAGDITLSGDVNTGADGEVNLLATGSIFAFVNAAFMGAGAKVWNPMALWAGFITAALIIPVFLYRHYVQDGGKFPHEMMEDLHVGDAKTVSKKKAGILPYLALVAGLAVVLIANIIFVV